VCALLPLVFAAGAADAQVRLYQVEVVIFAQPEGTSVELPPRQESPMDSSLATQEPVQVPAALTPAPGSAADAADVLPDPDDPSALLPDGFSGPAMPLLLEGVARRLDTRGYRLLWHRAWVQIPIDGRGPDLATLGAFNPGTTAPGLTGNISLSAGRFLHLGMDIELRSEFGLEAVLQQRRRIRPRTDQYFDHPHIGVVAVVTPVEADDDPAQSEP